MSPSVDVLSPPEPMTLCHGAKEVRGSTSSIVPSAWPTYLSSPMAWSGTQLRDQSAFTHTLNDEEKEEISKALLHFQDLELDGNEVNSSNFPLPTLGDKLRAFSLELHRGRGFFALRGLNPTDYSQEDNVVIFLGISAYVAEKRGKQEEDGQMLGHVREAESMKVPQHERAFRDSNVALRFHTDLFTDIVAMHTRSCAAKGGNHLLASSWTVYNELAATRPDLLHVLADPTWEFARNAQLSAPKKRALLHYYGGHIIFNVIQRGLKNANSDSELKAGSALSHEQAEALDAVQKIAEKHQVVVKMQPGDFTFVNNLALLHSREAFEDDANNKRYNVRLWLKNEQLAWKLPRAMQLGNQHIFYNNLVEEKWNVQPLPRVLFNIRYYPS